MLVAQISDPHLSTPGAVLHGGYRPEEAFARVLERVAGLEPRPDFVWLTGDLVETGAPEEYATLRRALEGFDLPMAAIPGNHDSRAGFAAALADGPAAIGTGPFLHLAVEDWPLRMLGLDTLGAEGAPAGALCPARLAWIEDRLAEAPDRPTLILMHHPTFLTGIGFIGLDPLLRRGRAGRGGGAARAGGRRRLRPRAPHGRDRLGRHPGGDLPVGRLGGAARAYLRAAGPPWCRRRRASCSTCGSPGRACSRTQSTWPGRTDR